VVKKSLFFILIIFVLGACNQQSSETNENVRKVVWSYIESEGNEGFYNKEIWDRAGVEKVKLEDKYKKYH
jgi:basic membrane lipoprotein Med (substrate-binding protein (PBP1-ABC) superfamily)